MKKHKPLGSVHPVNNKSMPSKHLTIHTVIKIYNFCPKWSIHQEYVAWIVFFPFLTGKSINVLIKTASSLSDVYRH